MVGGIAVWAGASEVESIWKLHRKLLAEQANAQTQLPLKLNEYTTLIGVRVGLASLTNVYRVTKPRKEDVNLSVFDAGLRRGVCSDNNKLSMIKDGASYSFEYHWDTGDVANFEISSCP